MGEQEVVSPSLRAALKAEEFPAWAAEPEPAPAPVSPREEEIASVLRAALAQGHSDETLADILRKVLAGMSPQAALPEGPLPEAALPETVLPEVTLPERGVFAEAADAEASWTGDPEPLWAEVAHVDRDPVRVGTDEPIWAEVVLHEPAPVPSAAVLIDDVVADDVVADDLVADVGHAADRPEAMAVAVAAEADGGEETTDAEDTADAVETVEAEAAEPFSAVLAAAEAPLLARTASDPAPLPLDATAVLPPLSLLPPRPSSRRGGGLPPVPPPARPSVPASARPAPAAAASTTQAAAAPVPPRTLATVTRLPVAPLHEALEHAGDVPAEPPAAEPPAAAPIEVPAEAPIRMSTPVPEVVTQAPAEVRPAPAEAPEPPAGPARRPSGVVGRLRALGLPEWLLGDSFATDAATHGTYAALTRALGNGLPKAAELPAGAGEVLLVVGPGVETLVAARSLAASLRLDPDRVQWASRGELAGLAPASSRMTTVETAIDRRQEAAGAGTLTIVAVDAPLRTDGHWMAQMLAIWTPAAVWAVVDATRKPEDVEPWLDGLPRVDALMVQDTDLSADPAAVLQRIAIPVALLDGVLATPHRWASVLCERLEKQQG